jgi:hypothetical protein
MGVRFRLKASFDISGFSATNQIILRAMKKYGMMIADNGSAWFVSGAPDPGWDNTDLHALTTITGSAFEVVDVSPLMVDPNSGQALQNGISVTVTPPSAGLGLNAQQQFSAVVNGSSSPVTWGVNGSPGGNSSVGFIDQNTGLYIAPNILPNPATVTVQATTSQTTPPVTGTASVTITGPPPPIIVTVSPMSASVRVGRTVQFKATVQNSANQTVTWSATAGTISSSGLYKAPSSVPSPNPVTIKAVSVADNTKSRTASVTITRR